MSLPFLFFLLLIQAKASTRRKESGSPQFGPRPSEPSLPDERRARVVFRLGVTGVLEEAIGRKGWVTDILGSMVESLVPLLLDMSLSTCRRTGES